MKVLSLFSGVGGFDMGLENAGMETVFQCEWDKHCRSILDRHWPTVPKWDDVSTLTGEHILAHAPVIDVVAWGSPCQDLSVAGKRAGLEGNRSGLFYEGMRIITELRKASNGKYPRISIWENVYGALNSNKGEDFEAILKEMVEAGSLLCEWRVLDAQYFGIPQRRRRVFVVAVFDSGIAERCPDPLLPVSEGLRWNPTQSATTRKEPADTVTASIGSGSQWAAGTSPNGDFLTTSVTSKWHKGSGGPSGSEHYNMVVEELPTVGALAARDYKGVGNQYVNKGKVIVEPFVKSRRAQSTEDHETWKESEVNPTINQFDAGDTRATTVIVGSLLGRVPGTNHEGVRDGQLVLENEPIFIDGTRVNDVRVYESPVQTLKERMGTGGNNVPMVAFSHTQGLDAQPSESAWPTLRKEGNGHAVAIGIQGNMIGRQDHNGPAGKGHTDEGDPMFTLTSTDIHAVAFDGYNQTVSNVSQTIRSDKSDGDHVGMVLQPTDPIMSVRRLTPAHVNAVAYDEYNDALGGTVHHALRAGTKQSTGVAVGTLRSGGDGGVPSSRGEHLVVGPTMVVRRLTPLECERLMGWPDHHTRYKADGTEQADTHRYKQCGNGVASPVAQWIGEQLINL
jgi:DNA-cytosine methyltransferase